MNIFIIRNSLNSFYYKLDNSLITEGEVVYLPDDFTFTGAIPSFYVKINKSGKYIKPEFAGRYYSVAGLALNFILCANINFKFDSIDEFVNFSSKDKTVYISETQSCEHFFQENSTNLILNDKEKFSYLLPENYINYINSGIFTISKGCTLKSGDIVIFELTEPLLINRGDRIQLSTSSISLPSLLID